MKKVKKIIAVSGARSEYDLLYSVYDKLNKDENFNFGLIITGPNLSDNYGYTAQQIERDGFKVYGKIFNLIDSSQKIGRIVSIGNQIAPLANLLNFEKPDLVLVAGDREEAITVTMTCAFLDIPVAHFFGGDIAKDGNIDNAVRYASSKFAHIHFPTLVQHKENLLKLGEDEWRIHVMGNPALDRFLSTIEYSKEETLSKMNKESTLNYALMIQHPIITEIEQQYENVTCTLEALLKYKGHVFVNSPNSDAGNYEIVRAYDEYAKNYPHKFTLFKNLDREIYINLLRHADFLIGNSSSGVVEVASLGLPAINVGTRQRGRIHGNNVIFTDYDTGQILEAIQKVTENKNFLNIVKKKENPYGDGNSSNFVVEKIKELVITDNLIYKNITY